VALASGAVMPIKRQKWTDAQLGVLREMTAAGATAAEIAKVTGHPVNGVYHARIEYDIPSRVVGRPKVQMVRPVASCPAPEGPTLVQAFAPMATEEESRDEFMARMLRSSQRSVEKSLAMNKITLRIPSRDPVGIMGLGDLHISPECTDLRWVLSRAELVAKTPGMYAIGLGDWLNNPIKHRPQNIAYVKDELRFMDLLAETFERKLLAMCTGNHDDFTEALAGFNHLMALARRHKFHAVHDELIYDIEIVDPDDVNDVTARWTVATRHQFRRHSNLNLTHATMRWLEENVANWETIPDVLMLAHNHGASHQAVNFRRKDVWGVRFGSAQVDSGYARQKGFPSYRPTAPTIVLPAQQSQRIQVFADAEDAITYVRGARDVAA
jgi:hypothetical protein